MIWNQLAIEHHAWVDAMGWHNKTPLECMALIASEIGEAAGEYNGGPLYVVELADIALRSMDLAVTLGVPVQASIDANPSPMAFNTAHRYWLNSHLMSLFGKWANTLRGETPSEDFAVIFGELMNLIVAMASSEGFELIPEIQKKMEINLLRGTRNRLK